MGTSILLHGSNQIIDMPRLQSGNPRNDYGRGFYCTTIEELAGEWACKKQTDGFINRYELEMTELNILNLSDDNHTVLNWIAILLKNRTFNLHSQLSIEAREYLIEHFAIDTTAYDLVVGYRADDSYFQYAEAFVENSLPLRKLNRALTLGNLGIQTVLVSEKAFSQLKFLEAEHVDSRIYYPKFLERDTNARQTYSKRIAGSKSYRNDIFVMDILREEMSNNDPRIQRILS